MNLWLACHAFEPSTSEDMLCRGGRCSLNLPRLKYPPMGVVWKLGSTSSLIAGITFGSILAYGAYQTSIDETNYVLSFMATSTLGAVMLIRFYNTGKFMPAGLMSTLRYLFFNKMYCMCVLWLLN
ncbi:UNVERIFIED_CONTAM: tmem14c [Trichonephila clavipes]